MIVTGSNILNSLGGLFEGKRLRMRSNLMYPRIVYEPAILLNLFVRFSWILLIAPTEWFKLQNSTAIVYYIAISEMIRRSVWCLFRVENEMVNNIGQFRAVREVPLP